jgi:transcription elongation factor Elf1
MVQTCDECGSEVVVESHGHNIIESTTMGVTIRTCSECGTPEEDLQAKIDIYNMLRDILNNIKNKEVFFDNSLLCDNKSRVLKKNNNERV